MLDAGPERFFFALIRPKADLANVRGGHKRPAGVSAAPVFPEDREEEVVLPAAVDQEIVAGIALLVEAGAQQDGAARRVGRQAGGLDPVQAQPVEGEIEDERQRRRHQPLAREGLADPVAEARRFGDAAAHVRKALAEPAPAEAFARMRHNILGAIAKPASNGVPPFTSEEAIAAWRSDRPKVPKNKAIRNKRGKLAALFAFLEKPDDLTQITDDDLQRYKEHLLKAECNNYARDHLIDIKAIFKVAADNRKFGKGAPNPAEKIRVPPKRQGAKRPAFTEDQAREILMAAREGGPVVRWSNWLAAFLGLITEEIVDADTRDVEIIDGIPCFHVRADHRTMLVDGATATNELKTDYRPRTLPLHPAFATDFLAYVEGVRRDYYGGGHGPLFPMIVPDRDGLRNTKASAEIMKFMRGLGIKNEVDEMSKKGGAPARLLLLAASGRLATGKHARSQIASRYPALHHRPWPAGCPRQVLLGASAA
jgi:integrase